MTALARLHELGVEMIPLPGGRIRWRSSEPLSPEARALLDELRPDRAAVLALLVAGQSPESLDCNERFGVASARLLSVPGEARSGPLGGLGRPARLGGATGSASTVHAVGADGRSRCGNLSPTAWRQPLALTEADRVCRSCLRLVALDATRWDEAAARRALEAVRAPTSKWTDAWRMARRDLRDARDVLDEILDEISASRRGRDAARHAQAVRLLDRLVQTIAKFAEGAS